MTIHIYENTGFKNRHTEPNYGGTVYRNSIQRTKPAEEATQTVFQLGKQRTKSSGDGGLDPPNYLPETVTFFTGGMQHPPNFLSGCLIYHPKRPIILHAIMTAHVLLIPYPGQGHLLPLLDLAYHLAAAGLAITVAVTTKNLPHLSPLLALSPAITPLVLPFPSHPSLPAGVENTLHLPPGSFFPLMHALADLHQPLLTWARSHAQPITAIISDMFLGWTYTLAADLGIPRLVFSPSGALAISVINSLWRDMPKHVNPDDPNYPIAFPSIPGEPVYPWRQLSIIYRSYKEGDPVWELLKTWFLNNISSWGYIFNTFTELEEKYLTHMNKQLGHQRVWAVGPLSTPTDNRGGPSSVPTVDLLSWLDKFDDGSVVYVCFGSQAVLAPPQAVALGAALERSRVRFVWGVKENGWVPEGLEERVAGRGMVIRGWVPQVAVLGHWAVGWFLTHCGWNSTLEALAAGVAMMTWPMTADQFMNARLLLDEVGVAVRVCEGADAVPDVEELAGVLTRAVEGGGPERKKAVELKLKATGAVLKDGSSYNDMEDLVEVLAKSKT